jgi:hypothetical protein
VRPSSPRQSSDDEQCFTPQDYDDSLSQSSSVENEDDLFHCAIEGDPDFPLLASNLSLQDDSDLTNSSDDESCESVDDDASNYLSTISESESNALTFPWTLPTPSKEWPIVKGVSINPVEESLLCLLIENNLLKRLYPAIMEWAHHAYLQDYD